jgi:transketolase
MPCWELFEAQTDAYKLSVFPKEVTARLVIEAGISMGWDRYVGPEGSKLTVDRFGASAPAEVVFEKFGFTVNNAVNMAKALIDR